MNKIEMRYERRKRKRIKRKWCEKKKRRRGGVKQMRKSVMVRSNVLRKDKIDVWLKEMREMLSANERQRKKKANLKRSQMRESF